MTVSWVERGRGKGGRGGRGGEGRREAGEAGKEREGEGEGMHSLMSSVKQDL